MSTYLVLASSSTRNNMIRLDLENFATDLYIEQHLNPS